MNKTINTSKQKCVRKKCKNSVKIYHRSQKTAKNNADNSKETNKTSSKNITTTATVQISHKLRSDRLSNL